MNEYGYRSLVVWQRGKTLATDIYTLKMLTSLIRARSDSLLRPKPKA
jgi:hypothetical protein